LEEAMAWCADCSNGVRLVWKSSPGCGLQSWTSSADGFGWVIESRFLNA